MTVIPYKENSNGKKEQVATMFNNISKKYDFLNHFLSLGIDILWRKKAIGLLKESQPQLILDIATGTGDFAIEALALNPTKVTGIDISKHAISQATPQIRPYMLQMDAKKPLPYHDKQFDLLISIGLLHNFRLPDLKNTINEINRVSKKSYTMVESYRNEQELFNLQCWALTAQSFFDDKEWEWIYKEYDYQGDYEFIYFK